MEVVWLYMHNTKYNHHIYVTGRFLMHLYLLIKIYNITPYLRYNLDTIMVQSSTLIDTIMTVLYIQ